MIDAASTASQTGTATPRSPEDARLLAVVAALITFGQHLLAALQNRNLTAPPIEIASRFRSVSLVQIITRITRGLIIARALEARLLRRQAQPAAAPTERPASTTPRETPADRRPRRTDADDDAELETGLPSAREIARRFRRRPVGAVIVEICRDLGINPQHPMWREIQKAIMFHGGSMVRLLKHWMRHFRRLEEVVALEAAQAMQPPLLLATPPP